MTRYSLVLRDAALLTCAERRRVTHSSCATARHSLVLRDEGVRGLHDVLLGAVEQEHGEVPQRAAGGGQRAHHLQQHRAPGAVIARA